MLLLLFVLLGLGSTPGHAAPSASSLPGWGQYFDGDASLLNQDYQPRSPFDSTLDRVGGVFEFRTWIRGYSDCEAPIDSMLESLRRYDTLFRKGDEAGAESAFTELSQLLSSSGTECLEPVRRAYWVGLLALGPENDPRFKDSYSQKNDLLLFATFLANEDVFRMLTPELRVSLAGPASDPKDSLWARKKDGEYLLSGIYDCHDAQIYLSSSLKPFNAAASLAHEIDHLYRDKIGYTGLVSWREHKDISEYIVSDEMIASVWGAFYQREIFLMDRALDAKATDYTWQGNEFNLFKRGGPLSFLMDTIGLRPPMEFFEFYGIVAQQEKEGEKKVMKALCDIQSTIRKGYFKGMKGCTRENLFPPAAYYGIENYLSALHPMRIDRARWPQLLAEYAQIHGALQSPSPVCVASAQAQEEGLLKGYIGNELKEGDTPGHPGNGGVKPGRLLRPCLKISY